MAAAVLIADLSSKWAAVAHLKGRPPIEMIPGAFRLAYTTNTGGAFGLSVDTPWFFAIASIAVSIAIVVLAFRVTSRWRAVAMGMVLGGAIGNLVNRFSGGLDMSGQVVDFLDARIWPVFNLADSAIVVGAAMLALSYAKAERDEKARRASEGGPSGEEGARDE